MEILKPKSHSPKIHDNTEEDIIFVPPSVLENKLRDFEEYNRNWNTLGSDITLAITLIVAIIAMDFRNFVGLDGPTIRGAFLIGFILMLLKIFYILYKILFRKDGKDREGLIKNLLGAKNSRNILENKKEVKE